MATSSGSTSGSASGVSSLPSTLADTLAFETDDRRRREVNNFIRPNPRFFSFGFGARSSLKANISLRSSSNFVLFLLSCSSLICEIVLLTFASSLSVSSSLSSCFSRRSSFKLSRSLRIVSHSSLFLLSMSLMLMAPTFSFKAINSFSVCPLALAISAARTSFKLLLSICSMLTASTARFISVRSLAAFSLAFKSSVSTVFFSDSNSWCNLVASSTSLSCFFTELNSAFNCSNSSKFLLSTTDVDNDLTVSFI